MRKYYAPAAPGGGGGGTGGGTGGGGSPTSGLDSLSSALGQLKYTLDILVEEVKDLADDWAASGREVDNIVDLTKALRKETRANLNLVEKIRKEESDVTAELRKASEYESDIKKMKQSVAYQTDLLNRLTAAGVDLSAEERKEMERVTKELEAQIPLLQEKVKLAKKQEERLEGEKKKVDDVIKTYGTFLGMFSKIPLIGGVLGQLLNADKVMGAMGDKAKKLGKEAETAKGRLKILGEGLKQTFMNITNPLTVGTLLVTGFFTLLSKVFMMAINLNKKFFETAKILGTSVGEATRLYNTFQAIAPLGMTAKQMAESYAAASDSLGFMASTGSDFAVTMTGLQKNIGASAEHMTALATQSALSGKSITGSFVSMVGSAKAAGAQNKLMLSTRQILDKIAKVSSTVLLNFKGNVDALAVAVVRATKLGVTLDQVNRQGESLLDFETSIAAQFEAEALSGKQFNLERARTLALEGKTADLMEELNTQGLTMTEWNSQNVIQKEAYAKMLGLSTEELSKQYILQQQAERLGVKEGQTAAQRYEQLRKQGKSHEQIVALIGAQEAASLRQQSYADKWQALLEKIQDTLGRIVMGPVTEIVNKVIAFLNNTEAIKAVGEKLKSIFQGIVGILENLPTILKNAVMVSKILASLAVARAVANLVAAGGMGGPAGIVAGLAVGGAAYYMLSNMVDNAMNGLTSPGERISAPNLSTAGNIQPANTFTSAYGSTASNNNNTGNGTTVVVHNTMEVDGHTVATTSNRHTVNDPRSTFDNSTNKSTMNAATA